ncbi:MAG: PadR family transcriptional regulator [Candidatus Dormibacteria bacterium]
MGQFVEGEFRRALRGGMGGRMQGPAGGRVPRGNVRAAILLLLEEQPRNGYQLMEEIDRRSKGVWRPSPGSVYPALQQMEDEGLVRSHEVEGQRLLKLTDAGRTYADEHRVKFGSPWEEVSGAVGDDVHELFSLMRQSAGALVQVVRAGDRAQLAQAAQLMRETKRGLYRILAEDEAPSPEPQPPI